MYVINTESINWYATVGVSKRDISRISIDNIYLCRFLDKDYGIYKREDRGVFTFDVSTSSFGIVPEDYVPAPGNHMRVYGTQLHPYWRIRSRRGVVFFI